MPIRPSRTTLGIDPFAPEARWVAHGEAPPLSRLGREAAAATALGEAAVNGTAVRSAAPHDAAPTGPDGASALNAASADDNTESVGVDIGSGPDPVLAAIAASGVRAATRDRDREDVVVVVERPGETGPIEMSEDGLGVAILEAAILARRAGASPNDPGAIEAQAAREAGSDATGNVAVMTRPGQAGAKSSHRPEARVARHVGARLRRWAGRRPPDR